MNGAVIYAKTRKGLEELTHRTAAVPQKVRSILILVDGKTRCSELLQKCSFISECKEHLEWLERNGLIEAVGTTNAPGAIASDAPPIPSQAPVTISPKKALIQLAQELPIDWTAAMPMAIDAAPCSCPAVRPRASGGAGGP